MGTLWTRVALAWDAQAELGEGPAWDARQGVLLWVDIVRREIHVFDPTTNHDRAYSVAQEVSAVVPSDDGHLVWTMGHSIYYGSLETGTQTVLASVTEGPETRFNDAKCDPAGRLWAGTMDRAQKAPHGSLYVLPSANEPLRRVIPGVTISNGLAWSPDEQTLYYIDSPTLAIRAFAFNAATGEIGDPRVVARIPPNRGMPDGLTVDSEGRLWVGIWGGQRVTVWDPDTGHLVEEIPIPARNVTSCIFGGDDLTSLYVTTARTGTSAVQLTQYPKAGGIFVVFTRASGLPTISFRS